MVRLKVDRRSGSIKLSRVRLAASTGQVMAKVLIKPDNRLQIKERAVAR